jgi:hypothetical protein
MVVACIDRPEPVPDDADRKAALRDEADHWNRMHVFRHFLARQKVDARGVDADDGFGWSTGKLPIGVRVGIGAATAALAVSRKSIGTTRIQTLPQT